MILILDHNDSFTYNLVSALQTLNAKCRVVSTAAPFSSWSQITDVSGVILSPGPGHPRAATAFYMALDKYTSRVPVLGVCLGHQAIACHFGGSIEAAETIVHGKPVPVEHSGSAIFSGLPQPFQAMRYNSLTVHKKLPSDLELSAWSGEEVMGVRHRTYQVTGVQFHPESIGTPQGYRLIANFVNQTTAK